MIKILNREFFIDSPLIEARNGESILKKLSEFNSRAPSYLRSYRDKNHLVLPHLRTEDPRYSQFLLEIKELINKGNLENDELGYVKYKEFHSNSGDYLLNQSGKYNDIIGFYYQTIPKFDQKISSKYNLKGNYVKVYDLCIHRFMSFIDAIEPDKIIIPLNKTSSSGPPYKCKNVQEQELKIKRMGHVFKQLIINQLMIDKNLIKKFIQNDDINGLWNMGMIQLASEGYRFQNDSYDKIREAKVFIDSNLMEFKIKPIYNEYGIRTQRARMITVVPQTYNLLITPYFYKLKYYKSKFQLPYKLKYDGINDTAQEKILNSYEKPLKCLALDMTKAESQLNTNKMEVIHKYINEKHPYIAYASAVTMTCPILTKTFYNQSHSDKYSKYDKYDSYLLGDFDKGYYTQLYSGHAITSDIYSIILTTAVYLLNKLCKIARNKFAELNHTTLTKSLQYLTDIVYQTSLERFYEEITDLLEWKEEIKFLQSGDDLVIWFDPQLDHDFVINLIYCLSGLIFTQENPSKFCGFLITRDSDIIRFKRDYCKVISNHTNPESGYSPIDINDFYLPRRTMAGLTIADLGSEFQDYLDKLEYAYKKHTGESLLAQAKIEEKLTFEVVEKYFDIKVDNLSPIDKEVFLNPEKLKYRYTIDDLDNKKLSLLIDANYDATKLYEAYA